MRFEAVGRGASRLDQGGSRPIPEVYLPGPAGLIGFRHAGDRRRDLDQQGVGHGRGDRLEDLGLIVVPLDLGEAAEDFPVDALVRAGPLSGHGGQGQLPITLEREFVLVTDEAEQIAVDHLAPLRRQLASEGQDPIHFGFQEPSSRHQALDRPACLVGREVRRQHLDDLDGPAISFTSIASPIAQSRNAS